jgi:hypothetical protein
MNIFIYHRSKEFSEALKSLYGVKKSSLIYSSGSYRNTLRTNLTSKVRLFKQPTLSTSDGGNRISTITGDTIMNNQMNINNQIGQNNARIYIDKGHIISKLDTPNYNNIRAATNAERLAVFNMDTDSAEFVSPPPKNEEFEKINIPIMTNTHSITLKIHHLNTTNTKCKT